MLPATKVVPKEMLPVAGKPLIQYAVEEAAASGIETVILVVRDNKSLIEATESSSEVVVSQADSLVGGGVSLDRLDHLLNRHHYQKFFWRFITSVDSFLGVISRHVPTVAGSFLFWTHNRATYKRRYYQWERSFLCQRCGTLMEQEF